MRKSYIINSFLLLFVLFISAGFFSCSSTKKIKYFQDIPDSGQLKNIASANYLEPKIQVDDILTVIIQTIDPLSTQIINSGNVVGGLSGVPSQAPSVGGVSSPNLTSGAQQAPSGYLVDKAGYIEIPILGKIKAIGYTVPELRDLVTIEASKYYKNPSVVVRYANFKVSVAGEVLKPGVFIVPNEKVTVLDALTLAGDLTIFGERTNVLLIRENLDGSRTPYRINLKKTDFMTSPYFYLRQNDYIYVQPVKGKAAATDASMTRNYTIGASILSIIAIIVTRK